MLTLQDLTHHYQSLTPQGNALTLSFSLSVEQGDIVALIGPSGAGKSTLLAMVAGFLAPDNGKLTINHQAIHQQSPAERPLSMLFQEHNLFPHLTVSENIGLGIHPGLTLSQSDKEAIVVAAARVGIQPYLDRLPEQLSGGQKQRVALARCLVRQRPLLLLDEPFSALDPALRKEMLELVRSLAQEQGTTVVMVTHSPDDVRKIANKCAFIAKGQVRVFGETAKVLDNPQDEALKHYLGL
ncbi:thiamine ABC transporter ATP-binding protein [Photobacterium jeanii]|uniref:Thiamine ABC transporter ATP-binding protein n=1 Tax=Photobacterium jeanii TaxID=858640 RepID=A0A178KNR3_9GAMM|nr:thiamine ABC transporter ATP-binding protein [Photobacterium jeanii]OAN19009.1 thiamine ABC transporter ATP-binding protein [Photobacterium jeanii]PST87672.1 thiamine ABC transporter ATP-binding protein [Photobacterium jeanii]